MCFTHTADRGSASRFARLQALPCAFRSDGLRRLLSIRTGSSVPSLAKNIRIVK